VCTWEKLRETPVQEAGHEVDDAGDGVGPDRSPTLFATDRETYVVQGWRVDDAEALRRMDVPDHEACVEVPAALLHRHLPATAAAVERESAKA
jgi:hypothetical protein